MLRILHSVHRSGLSLSKNARLLSSKTKVQIETLIKENPVLVFMKGDAQAPQCGFSKAVVQILTLQGVEKFKAVNVLADNEIRAGIKEFNSWPTIPQVFIKVRDCHHYFVSRSLTPLPPNSKGEFIGGTDILLNMHKSGELEDLLIKEGIVKDE